METAKRTDLPDLLEHLSLPAHEDAVVMQAVLVEQAGVDKAPDDLKARWTPTCGRTPT